MLFKTLLVLAVLAVLFPAVRRRLTRIGWAVFGAVIIFLIIASIGQNH
jgi:hypothetical protein